MLTAPKELLEYSAQDKLTVDWNDGVIRGVRLHAQRSKNGYWYSDKSMKSLLELYKDTGLYLNHKQSGVDKLFAHPANLTLKKEDGQYVIRGDAMMNVKHVLYEKIMDDAENRPHLLRFSHEVPEGQFEFGDDEVIDVFKVRKLSLIDTDGGVNKGIFETLGDPPMSSVKELREAHGDLVELIEQKALEGCECQKEGGAIDQCCELTKKVEELEEQLQAKQAELDELNESLQAEERKKSIVDLAEEKNRKLTDGMLEMLLTIKGDDADKRVAGLIEDLPEVNDSSDPEPPKYKSNVHQNNNGSSGARRNVFANL